MPVWLSGVVALVNYSPPVSVGLALPSSCLVYGVPPSLLSAKKPLISSSVILNWNPAMPRLLSTTLNCCVERLSLSARGRESHPLGANEFSSCGLLLVNKCENLLEQFLHCHQLAQKESGNTHARSRIVVTAKSSSSFHCPSTFTALLLSK